MVGWIALGTALLIAAGVAVAAYHTVYKSTLSGMGKVRKECNNQEVINYQIGKKYREIFDKPGNKELMELNLKDELEQQKANRLSNQVPAILGRRRSLSDVTSAPPSSRTNTSASQEQDADNTQPLVTADASRANRSRSKSVLNRGTSGFFQPEKNTNPLHTVPVDNSAALQP